MAGWEYQVIHINVEPPRPAGPSAPAEGPAGAGSSDGMAARSMFSQSFLKKEFPQFYETPSSQPSGGPPQHPAQQLQAFLNGHGAQGWELVGVFPVGNLTMMFFRRPKPSEPQPATAASEPGGTAKPVATAAPEPTAAGEGSLREIFRRLDELEGKLRGHDAKGRREPEPAPAVASSLPPSDWVSAAQLASLADETPLPSGQAAQAIGLRSATSLANHGARYGYAPGLSKRGPNGLVAIYTGLGPAEKGGKERRLWIVVPSKRLEN